MNAHERSVVAYCKSEREGEGRKKDRAVDVKAGVGL